MFKRGAAFVGTLVTIGTMLVGWLWIGINKAQDTASAAKEESAVNSSEIIGMDKRLTSIEDKLDVQGPKLDKILNKLNIK